MAQLKLINGLLEVEGGVAISGITQDMVTNIRQAYEVLGSLVRALDGTEMTDEVATEHHRAKVLLDYLRTQREQEKANVLTAKSTYTRR